MGVLPVPPTVRFPMLSNAARPPCGKRSSGTAVQKRRSSRDSAIRDAPAAFDKKPRRFPHLFHPLRIAKEFNPGHAGILGALHLHGSSRREEAGSDLR